MLGRASRPSPLPCAPGKYREICDLVTARKRTRAAKSLISAEPQGKFPNRPNRELIRPDRDLSRGVGKWRILGFGGSKNPLLYPAPYQNCIPTGKKRAPAQGPGLLLARHHRGSVGTGAAISTQLFLPLSVLPAEPGICSVYRQQKFSFSLGLTPPSRGYTR